MSHTELPEAMRIVHRWSWRLLAGLAALLSTTPFLTSCDDEHAPPAAEPACLAGTVEIRVAAPDSGGALYTDVLSVDPAPYFQASSWSKSSRDVLIPVPWGRYLLRARIDTGDPFYYATAGPVGSEAAADTLEVTAANPHALAGFRLGSVALRVAAPPSLDGLTLYARLVRSDAVRDDAGPVANAICRGGEASFRFPAIRPGDYRARIHWQTFCPSCPDPSLNEFAGQRLIVEAERRTEATIDVPDAGYISGVVRGSWQQFGSSWSPSVSITALDQDSSIVLGVHADRDGRWLSPVHRTAPLRIALTIFGVTRWIGGADFRSAAVFEPAVGETLVVPDEVESGLFLRLEGPPGEAVTSAMVEIQDSLGMALARLESPWDATPAENRFAVCNLLPGTLYLRICRRRLEPSAGWSSSWYDRAADREHATPVRIRQRGEVVVLDAHLPEAARIIARLRRSESDRYRANFCRLFSAADTVNALDLQGQSAADDSLVFAGMPPGRYLLSTGPFQPPGGARWWYPGTWAASAAQPVEIRDFGETREVEWPFPR